MAKNKFYVVWKGLSPGIYDNWAECTVKISIHKALTSLDAMGNYEKLAKM